MTRQPTKQKPRAEIITFRRLAVIHNDDVEHLIVAADSGDREARAVCEVFQEFQNQPNRRDCIDCDVRMAKVATTLVILGDEGVVVLGYCGRCSQPCTDLEDWTGVALATLGRLGYSPVTVGHS
jgi:hypothetical protein